MSIPRTFHGRYCNTKSQPVAYEYHLSHHLSSQRIEDKFLKFHFYPSPFYKNMVAKSTASFSRSTRKFISTFPHNDTAILAREMRMRKPLIFVLTKNSPLKNKKSTSVKYYQNYTIYGQGHHNNPFSTRGQSKKKKKRKWGTHFNDFFFWCVSSSPSLYTRPHLDLPLH